MTISFEQLAIETVLDCEYPGVSRAVERFDFVGGEVVTAPRPRQGTSRHPGLARIAPQCTTGESQ